MDWLTRAIDVRDIFTECQECEHQHAKKISTFCSNCIYNILQKKMEAEQRAYLEREKKQNGNS
jgi:thiamine biosynthesis protein ThiC